MSASWKPDPSGRHELRWWDGQGWTDHVADAGVTATDPYTTTPPATPTPPAIPTPPVDPPVDDKGTVVFAAQPRASTAPAPSTNVPAGGAPPVSAGSPPSGTPSYLSGGGAAATPNAAAGTSKKKFPVIPIIGLVVVVAIAAVVYFVFLSGGGGGDDSGSSTIELRAGETFTIPATGGRGEIIVVYAVPLGELDIAISALASQSQIEDFYDEYTDQVGTSFSEFEETLGRADQYDFLFDDLDPDLADGYVFWDRDDAGLSSGDPSDESQEGWERSFVILPSDGEYAVAVTALEGDGDVTLGWVRCERSVDFLEVFDALEEDSENGVRDLVDARCAPLGIGLQS